MPGFSMAWIKLESLGRKKTTLKQLSGFSMA